MIFHEHIHYMAAYIIFVKLELETLPSNVQLYINLCLKINLRKSLIRCVGSFESTHYTAWRKCQFSIRFPAIGNGAIACVIEERTLFC
jgi:hypothetical protein